MISFTIRGACFTESVGKSHMYGANDRESGNLMKHLTMSGLKNRANKRTAAEFLCPSRPICLFR